MKQAFMPEKLTIKYREVEKPEINDNEVLLKISRIGICGSDLHVYKGKHPLVSFPLVQGHEFSGYIEELGSEVKGFEKGDLVTVQPAIGCGECRKCKKGIVAQCDKLQFIGGAVHGAGSEYFKVDAAHVVKIPNGVSADDAAMVEPAAVAVRAVSKVDSIEGKDVVVFGAGTIGNLVAQVAGNAGAGKIILADLLENRLDIAKKLGFTVINPGKTEDLIGDIHRILGNNPPEVVFECVGNKAVLNNSISLIDRGGQLIVLGVYEDQPETNMVMVQDKEIEMTGSLMYTWDDYYRAVELISRKEIKLEQLRTHHFKFEEWEKGYRLLMEKPDEAIKVIIDL